MKWTEEKPTVEGWYWWKRGNIVAILEIREFETGLFIQTARPIRWKPISEAIVDQWSTRIGEPK